MTEMKTSKSWPTAWCLIDNWAMLAPPAGGRFKPNFCYNQTEKWGFLIKFNAKTPHTL